MWSNRPSMKNIKRSKRRQASKINSEVTKEQLEWQDTYALINNLDGLHNKRSVSVMKKNGIFKITELQRVSMALLMNDQEKKNKNLGQGIQRQTFCDYIYNPRHLVYNELCMIIQVKYFRLLKQKEEKRSNRDNFNLQSVVIEITKDEYDLRRTPWDKRYPYTPNEVCSAHEIVFSPMGENSSRPSIWFDITPTSITSCSHQQVKKIKRSRQRLIQQAKSKQPNSSRDKTFSLYPGSDFSYHLDDYISLGQQTSCHTFESHPQQPFFYTKQNPCDETSTQLIRDIMIHHIQTLISRQMRGKQLEIISSKLSAQANILKKRFLNLKSHYLDWKLPKNRGRDMPVDDNTPVPRCIDIYLPQEKSSHSGIKVWKSFVKNFETKTEHSVESCSKSRKEVVHSRLKVFCDLSEGRPIKE